METIIHNVGELGVSERSAVEQLVGHRLNDHQRVIIQVVGVTLPAESALAAPGELPDWCNVYEGVTDDEISKIEQSIVRCTMSRSVE